MVSPCLPLHMAVIAVHAPLHMPAFCLDQRSDSRGAPRYSPCTLLAALALVCGAAHTELEHATIRQRCLLYVSCAAHPRRRLAPAHATIIWEGWDDDYVYAPLTGHVGDDLVLFWYWLQDHNVVVMPAREALTSF